MITLNYIICALGAFLCLYALITRSIDNDRIAVFLFFSFFGLVWADLLFMAQAYQEQITVLGIVSRIFLLLALCCAIHEVKKGCNRD